MNAGKLIAEIAVLAIVVYCAYGVVVAAMPNDANDITNPFEVNEMSLGTSVDGMNLEVTAEGSVTSHLPQDLEDVSITVYIGERDARLELGTAEIGTIGSDATTIIDEKMTVPVYAVMAYVVTTADAEDDTLILPLCIKVGFKYLEWMDSYLIDMDLTVKQDLEMAGIASTPTITSTEHNGVEVSVKVDDGLLDNIAGDFSGTHSMTCGDAKFEVNVDGSGTIKFDAVGTDSQTAADLLKQALKDNGTLTFTSGGEDYSLNAEQSKTFIDLVDKMYEEASP